MRNEEENTNNTTNNNSGVSAKEEQKVRSRCHKWLGRLNEFLVKHKASLAYSADAPSSLTGCVVLNGGALAGNSIFTVRQLLLESSVLAEAHADPLSGQFFYASPTLPFVFVKQPVRDVAGNPLVFPLSVRMPHSWTGIVDAGRLTEDGEVGILALRTPHSKRPANSGSSRGDGCGFLFILPCDASRLIVELRDLFQRPVLNVAPTLLGPDVRVVAGTEGGRAILPCMHIDQVPGLYCVRDFISAEEHDAIVKELTESTESLRVEHLSRRRAVHFNRRFIYGSNSVGAVGEEVSATPSFYAWMQQRLNNTDPHTSVLAPYPISPGGYPCDQLTVNYYDYSGGKSCGIAAHVDAHTSLGDYILVVSLGSYTVMEFSPWDSENNSASSCSPVGVYLEPRSLVVMSGASRYSWTHCIAERRTDALDERVPTQTRGNRVSLTWRKGRESPHLKSTCICPQLCDGENVGLLK